MLIIDSHLDLSWNALQYERDLLQSVQTIRILENTMDAFGRGNNTVAFPEMRQGRIFLSFATMLARNTGRAATDIDYRHVSQTWAVARGQLAYYRALEKLGIVRVITNHQSLNLHVQEWRDWELASPLTLHPSLGFVLSMESADPILSPAELDDWHAVGLRAIGPAHYGPGRYAGGTGTELGLSEIGKELLVEMERLGMMLDMTHFSDQAFWQAIEIFGGAILASHQNSRTLCPNQRQFTDDQLKAIIARDGVIGASFDVYMVKPGWVVGGRNNPLVTLADVVDHIDYVCQLAGNANHAAIGSDLDGGFGQDQSPRDLDTIADLQKVVGILESRGYKQADIEAIMHGNWLRMLHRCLA